MEIEKKNTTQVRFNSLEVGDVFLDEDEDVMMVVDEDYGLGDCAAYDGYAVNLKDGRLFGFEKNEMVIKVSAKLIVTD